MKDSTRNKYTGQNVMTGRKLNSTDSYFFAADHSYFEIFDKVFLVSLFQLLMFHCPRKTFSIRIHSELAGHYTGEVLIVRGVGIFPQI